MSLDTGLDVNIVTVYFPCYRSSFSYSNDLAKCLSYLEDVMSNGKPSVIIGDMNFPCDFNNEGFSQCHNVMSCYRVFHCDELINSGNCITYCNHSVNQFNDIALLHLQESYSLSVIMYAIPALSLTNRQVKENMLKTVFSCRFAAISWRPSNYGRNLLIMSRD